MFTAPLKTGAKRAILEASLGLAPAFDSKTIAEGVGLQEDFELLEDLACDVVQGFYLSRPLPPDKLIELTKTGLAAAVRQS